MHSLIPISIPKCELSPIGATFNADLTWSEWIQTGHQLIRVARCLQWMIGDWLNFGEAKWGEKYRAALEIVDYDEHTLRNFAWVCGSVQLSRRRDKLTFSHHAEVAAMKPKEQEKWLAEAEDKGWSVSELRVAIRRDGLEPVRGGSGGFNVLKWATDGIRWFRTQIRDEPIDQWPLETRSRLKKDMEPLVRIWERL